MSIDFSWLITALQNIASNIVNFFNSIWSAVTQITNTGQGIFAGLANFGGWLYQGLIDAFNSVYNGIKWIADQIRGAWDYFSNMFYSAWNFLSSNLFAVGQWLWAGIQGFANMMANAIMYLSNAIYQFAVTTYNTIFTYVANFKLATDQWWANLVSGIRAKIKSSIMYSVTTHIAWQSLERIPKAKSLSDWLFGLGGILVAPIPAYVMSEMLDVMLPTPSSVPQKVAPDLTGLTLTAPTIEEKYPTPPTPTAPTALVVGVGVTGEFVMMSMDVYDGIVAPTVSGEFNPVLWFFEDLDVTPTVTVTTELI